MARRRLPAMVAIRRPDGQSVLLNAPAGTEPVLVDDRETPAGRVPTALRVRLPGGRVVAVPIRRAGADEGDEPSILP